MNRPCPSGNHNITAVGMYAACLNCPLKVDLLATTRKFASRPRASERDTLREAFRQAERDWYIQELES